MPKMIYEVTAFRPNEYTKKDGTEVKESIVALVDKCPSGYRLAHTVEYVIPADRLHLIPTGEARGLLDKRIELGQTGQSDWNDKPRVTGEVLSIDGKKVNWSSNGKAADVTSTSR